MKQFWLFALLVALCLPSSVAEVVYLEGGTVLRGKIVRRDAAGIELVIPQQGGDATVTLPLARIRRIAPDGETPEMMTAEGHRLLRAGDPDRAEALFADALRERPTHTAARIGLALAAGSRNKPDEALRQLQRALLLAPSSPEAWYYLGYFQARRGKPEAARSSLRRAAALSSDAALSRRIKLELRRIAQLSAQTSRAASAGLRAARSSWDKNTGSDPDAAAAGVVLREMKKTLSRTLPDFKDDLYVELKAPAQEQRLFAAGGSLARYRHAVQVAQVSWLVDIASWEKLTNREKREIVGGWLRYLKDIYPFATTIGVVSDGKRYLVEAVWLDLQDRVRFHWHRTRDVRKK